jgi:hypothetical protein
MEASANIPAETKAGAPGATGRARGRWRALVANLALGIAALLVTLLLAELVFRVAGIGRPSPPLWQADPKAFVEAPDPELGYTFRPGFQGRIWNAPVAINRLGMRDAEIPATATQRPDREGGQEFRVLVLGDSITFGISVALDETFPKCLERLLNGSRRLEAGGGSGAGTEYRVYNAGVPSYNTVQEWRFLERLAEPVAPDLVIVGFTLMNDWETRYRLEGSGFIAPTTLKGEEFSVRVPLQDSLGRVSYVYRYAAEKYRRWAVAPAAKAVVERAMDSYRKNADGWRRCKESLLAMKALLDRRSGRLALFIYPEPTARPVTRREEYPYLDVHGIVERFCAENGIAYLDVLDDFVAYPKKKELWVAPTDAHPSRAAHELVAKALRREIREKKLLRE